MVSNSAFTKMMARANEPGSGGSIRHHEGAEIAEAGQDLPERGLERRQPVDEEPD